MEELLPVPVSALKYMSLEDLDIYLVHNGRTILYKRSGIPVTDRFYEELGEGATVFYVKKADSNKLVSEIERSIKTLLESLPPTSAILKSVFDEVSHLVDVMLSVPSRETLKKAEGISHQIAEYVETNPKAAYLMAFTLKKDFTTALHVSNVSALVSGFAYHLGYRGDDFKRLSTAALMHDIGKTKVPDEILKKPGNLTKEEYEVIKKHTIWGGQILEKNGMRAYAPAALYHHECIDGSGYPRGLVGSRIPDDAKIVQICDVYEALVGLRPYRNPLDPFDALSLLRDEFVLKGKVDKALYKEFLSFLYKHKE